MPIHPHDIITNANIFSSHDHKTKEKWELVPKSNERTRMQNQIDRRSQFKGSMCCTHGRANALEQRCNMEVSLPAYLASLALIVHRRKSRFKGGCVARIIALLNRLELVVFKFFQRSNMHKNIFYVLTCFWSILESRHCIADIYL